MDNSIHVQIQPTAEWDTLRHQIESTFLALGTRAGDDPDLMSEKAARAYGLIRNIVENAPVATFEWTLPDDVPSWDVEEISGAIKRAMLMARATALNHLISLLLPSLYLLCTSQLTGVETSRQFS